MVDPDELLGRFLRFFSLVPAGRSDEPDDDEDIELLLRLLILGLVVVPSTVLARFACLFSYS